MKTHLTKYDTMTNQLKRLCDSVFEKGISSLQYAIYSMSLHEFLALWH